MSDLMKRLDRVAGHLENLTPAHDLTAEEVDAFVDWLQSRNDQTPDEGGSQEPADPDIRYMSNRELWKALTPTIAEWRATQ